MKDKDVFVTREITNEDIFNEIVEIKKILNSQKWQLRTLWIGTGGIIIYLLKFLVLKI